MNRFVLLLLCFLVFPEKISAEPISLAKGPVGVEETQQAIDMVRKYIANGMLLENSIVAAMQENKENRELLFMALVVGLDAQTRERLSRFIAYIESSGELSEAITEITEDNINILIKQISGTKNIIEKLDEIEFAIKTLNFIEISELEDKIKFLGNSEMMKKLLKISKDHQKVKHEYALKSIEILRYNYKRYLNYLNEMERFLSGSIKYKQYKTYADIVLQDNKNSDKMQDELLSYANMKFGMEWRAELEKAILGTK